MIVEPRVPNARYGGTLSGDAYGKRREALARAADGSGSRADGAADPFVDRPFLEQGKAIFRSHDHVRELPLP
jgi:hypothetical protein